jgi:leucine dehydrogenase
LKDWFRDGLRLSKGMTHKNALADIWWGGGKGVMARNTGHGLMSTDAVETRRLVYEEYGVFMSTLKGCYVTAEDAGTHTADMAAVFSKTRFTTCIPQELGGSGNPSIPTARGVVKGLQAAFDHLGKSIVGSTIAIQGLGNVAFPLVGFLFDIGVGRILATDVDETRVKHATEAYKAHKFTATRVPIKDNSILYTDCDAVSPNAIGGILNPETIPNIKAPIICGAANNQLGHIQQDDKLLQQHNITLVPDFLVNRMGIVTCADEAAGYLSSNDTMIEKHLGQDWDHSIYNTTRRVLAQANAQHKTSQEIALALAEEMSRQLHPIFGHRGKLIIEQLVTSQEWVKML